MDQGFTVADVVHVVVAVGSVVTSCLSVYLAHKRKRADSERRWFYDAMSKRLELPGWDAERSHKGRNTGNGR